MIGILLAAGFSKRFGAANKLLQPISDGRMLALAAAENLIKAIPLSIAVLRPDNKILADALQNAGLKIVFCSAHEQQMADSLAVAIRHSASYPESADGFVITLADMPYINPLTISAVAKDIATGRTITVPTYHGQRGHPVGFAAKFRDELAKLKGDEGARSIIKRYADEVHLLECDDAGIITDIDTPDDLISN